MAKFKVGDWVKVVMPPNSAERSPITHILEIHQQTCEANIEQTAYTVRLWNRDSKGITGFTQQITLREMELGEKVEM